MDSKIREVLLKFDEVGRYEKPSRFNFKRLKLATDNLKINLESTFSAFFDIDYQIQDASFFCEIRIPNELVEKYSESYSFGIRVSNFGKLVSISFEESYSTKILNGLTRVIEGAGFIYIPEKELEYYYDGGFSEFKKIYHKDDLPTWRVRFFDYL